MKIIMKRTEVGTEDGFTTMYYEVGTCYDVREHLARYFVSKGFAEWLPEVLP